MEGSEQGAEVVDLSSHYSGHGDQQKLLDNIFELVGYKGRQGGTTVFINHGEPGSKETFRAKIMERNKKKEKRPGQRKVAKALIANDDWFDLEAGDYAQDTRSLTKQELQEEIERLQKLLQTA
ncbi:MBL fold metallo-hydrolase RNA specificity domain-containing protein [Marinobacter salexigens]|uniref:MBL fold metallo-hydrolase RNA specificity domain-containing protein n=1 Tax=Marinobacter salexigens TaxID=1925763 RepID=UPI002091232C|nr:MBL fold metallo-hydrolase RNA specificity domain-containing protein [Marinobacter salexigens]